MKFWGTARTERASDMPISNPDFCHLKVRFVCVEGLSRCRMWTLCGKCDSVAEKRASFLRTKSNSVRAGSLTNQRRDDEQDSTCMACDSEHSVNSAWPGSEIITDLLTLFSIWRNNLSLGNSFNSFQLLAFRHYTFSVGFFFSVRTFIWCGFSPPTLTLYLWWLFFFPFYSINKY